MAGEIQLNSTTLATESSGSITAEVDTIRPNTTNGSLTLQGDSSDAGVTGLTIDSSGNTALGGVLKLKSSGNSITASDGTTAVLSESSGVVTLDPAVVGSVHGFEVYQLSSDITANGLVTGFTLKNSAPYGVKGDLIEESSGIISFNSTGIYLIQGTFAIGRTTASQDTIILYTKVTTNNSTYTERPRDQAALFGGPVPWAKIPTLTIINCTDTSNIKFQFDAQSIESDTTISSGTLTTIIVMKIG